jgi:hypothetical protein
MRSSYAQPNVRFCWIAENMLHIYSWTRKSKQYCHGHVDARKFRCKFSTELNWLFLWVYMSVSRKIACLIVSSLLLSMAQRHVQVSIQRRMFWCIDLGKGCEVFIDTWHCRGITSFTNCFTRGWQKENKMLVAPRVHHQIIHGGLMRLIEVFLS